MSDTLDVFACGRATERSRDVNGRDFVDVGRGLLLDSNVSPMLADYFRDLESRHALNLITARAHELNAMHDVLTTLAEIDAAHRIPLVTIGPLQ